MFRANVLAIALAVLVSSHAAAQSPGRSAPPAESWYGGRPPTPSCPSAATAAIDVVVRAVGVGAGAGHLRLLVEPPTAEVYVDGYYAGTAQAFEVPSLRTRLRPGRHRVELRASGYWSPVFEIEVPRRGTAVWRGVLVPVTPAP